MKINSFSSIGKSIDQPVVVAKLGEAVPALLIGGAVVKCGIETYKAPEEKKKDTFIKTALVLAGTIAGALLASRQTLGSFSVKKTIESQKKIADEILKNNKNLSENDALSIKESIKHNNIKAHNVNKIINITSSFILCTLLEIAIASRVIKQRNNKEKNSLS